MNIFISNVGSKVTDDSLSVIFATYGRVLSSAIIIDDQFPGKRLGYVLMPDPLEANLAIQQLNGCYIDGNEIIVMPFHLREKH